MHTHTHTQKQKIYIEMKTYILTDCLTAEVVGTVDILLPKREESPINS